MIINVPFQFQVDSLAIFFIRLDPTALRPFCREESRCVASKEACKRDIGNSFRTHCFVLSLLASVHLHLITLLVCLRLLSTQKQKTNTKDINILPSISAQLHLAKRKIAVGQLGQNS